MEQVLTDGRIEETMGKRRKAQSAMDWAFLFRLMPAVT
jgi:hypothetical protein